MATQTKIPSSVGNFDRIVEPFELDSAPIKLAKWKSRKTGLSVVWADIEGPLVNGYFTVATEVFNDTGVPHTLEHLVFLGSEKYPYKGILDTLANRAFANGTNAGTATTYTSYTVTTAGSDGFLRLLPIYLDHIFYPTITPEGFTTEVYHLNGEGEEAGVVYSEMQGVENTSENLMLLSNERALYPTGSAYRSEPGGLTAALRVLKVKQIRQYHGVYYRPHNLQLLVSGKIDPLALLNVLNNEVEPSLIKHGEDRIPQGWKRPFLESASKGGAVLTESKTVEVEFPAQDESTGEVSISWVGPNINEFLLLDALDILGTYLSDSSVSPLVKQFIAIDEPYCSEISFDTASAEKAITTASLSSVPTTKFSELVTKFKNALAHESDHIDMKRIKAVIERTSLMLSNQMEVNATRQVSAELIKNFLFGNGEQLVSGLAHHLQRYKTLAEWSVEKWKQVFKKWLVDLPSVTVIGKPSAKLAEKLEADTQARLEANKKKYGPEGLKKLENTLLAAQKKNDTPFPNKILSDFAVPSIESIQWNQIETATTDGKIKSDFQTFIDQKDSSTLPFFIEFNHVSSSFLTLSIFLSPTKLPADLFQYLPVYLSSFFSLPVKRSDGTTLPHDKVVRQLSEETVRYRIRLGSSVSQTIEVMLKIEKTKYKKMIGWLKDLLWGSVFDADRLRMSISGALSEIPSLKRDGSTVTSELYQELSLSADLAPSIGSNLYKKEVWLPKILEQLGSQPQEVIKQMNRLRTQLLQPSTMRICVIGNIRELEEPKKSWLDNFQKLSSVSLEKPLYSNALLSADGKKPSGKAVVVSISSTESTFARHIGLGPQGFDHPDQAAFTLAVNALNAAEGFLWKAIRGTGLAYGAYIYSNPESGHVYLDIDRSPDSWQAAATAGQVMKDLISKKLVINELTLDGAKSAFAFETAYRLSNPVDAAFTAFTNLQLQGVDRNQNRNLLQKLNTVTVDQVISSIQTYLLPIFDPRSSVVVVASGVSKAKAISANLQSAGYKVEQRQTNVEPASGDSEKQVD